MWSVALPVVFTFLTIAWIQHDKQKKKLIEELKFCRKKAVDDILKLEQQDKILETAESKRREERKGRITVEKVPWKELRSRFSKELNTSNGYFLKPIGIMHSCYKECLGTPRQGKLAPLSQGYIAFLSNISSESLDQLEEFSHLWISFIFHHNTNVKIARAHEHLCKDSKRFTFPAKVSPPMLKRRVGIYSTRSPHRPNAIGITLAKLEKIQGRNIYLSGIDLIDGTPILDIKPYIPAYDCIPDAVVPEWISNSITKIRTVSFHSDVIKKLKSQDFTTLEHLKKENILEVIKQILQVDIRSINQTRKAKTKVCDLLLDKLKVSYIYNQEDEIVVISIDILLEDK